MATATAMALAPERMSSIRRFYPLVKSFRKPRLVCDSVSFTSRCQIDFKLQVEKSIYTRELEAAVEVVERACRLCLSVQAGLKLNGDVEWEKSDASPVTVADLGVQALVSLGLVYKMSPMLMNGESLVTRLLTKFLGVELGLLFPSIPLVGEEDSKQLREDLQKFQKQTNTTQNEPLVETVTQAIASVASTKIGSLTAESILNALDRGVKCITETDPSRVSYWILDPIDGTRGFLRGGDALYVVGLALVVEGEVVLGVMGCPNVQYKYSDKFASGAAFSLEMVTAEQSNKRNMANCCGVVKAPPVPRGFQSGLLMAACSGCGCWVGVLSRNVSVPIGKDVRHSDFKNMVQCKVDGRQSTKEALFCISDDQEWSDLPLAQALASLPAEEDRLPEYEAMVLSLCCGSLCKYFAIALGGASVFVQYVSNSSQVKVWDHAAGVICVVEAGGQVTDVEGTALQKMLGNGQQTVIPQGGAIIASNGSMHELTVTSLSSSEMSFG